MRIKPKLYLGVGVLFIMIATLTIVGVISVYNNSNHVKSILVANYNSVDYARKMNIAIDEGLFTKQSRNILSTNAQLQKNNVTEVGEQTLTDSLLYFTQQLLQQPSNLVIEKKVKKNLQAIVLLNMQAIQRKTATAEQSAENAIFWISLVGTICFLVAFILLVNLPSNIANPIKTLTTSIQQIAAENYAERIHFAKENEFGQLAMAFNTMAQKLEEYKNTSIDNLMTEKKRIDALIENMEDAVIGIDEKDTIVFVNNAAVEIVNIKKEQLIYNNINQIAYSNNLINQLNNYLHFKEQNNKPLQIFINNKESYFDKRVLPIEIIPTGEEAKKQIGTVILLKNITNYKELDIAKTNFIATVSHELKTPIAAIQLSTQLLNNTNIGSLNKEQTTLVKSITDDATRLLKITSELLNITQLESGTMQLHKSLHDINSIIESAINANKQQALYKNIKVKKIVSTTNNVLIDKEKTIWVISNLISNAIRFSYENATIQLIAKDANANFIEVSVVDNGEGIQETYLSKIFDKYFKVPGTKKEGTGLGLSISKEFIEAQGGTIQVISDYGAGTTFTITLPTDNS